MNAMTNRMNAISNARNAKSNEISAEANKQQAESYATNIIETLKQNGIRIEQEKLRDLRNYYMQMWGNINGTINAAGNFIPTKIITESAGKVINTVTKTIG